MLPVTSPRVESLFPGCGGRFPNHKLGRDKSAVGHCQALEFRNKRRDGARTQFAEVLAHCRQGRQIVAGIREIIETHDTHVLWNSDAGRV